MRTTLLSLLAGFGLALAPLAAQQPQQPPMGPPGAMADSTEYEGLGLTADQRAKIQAIRDSLRQENAPLREQLGQVTGGRRWRELSPAERDSLRPKIEPIRRQLMDNVRQARQQIDAVLTPEQRQKLRDRMRARRGGMRGPPN